MAEKMQELKGLDDLRLELENDLSKLIADYEEAKKRHNQCSKNYLDLDTDELMADKRVFDRLRKQYEDSKVDLLIASENIVNFVMVHRNSIKIEIGLEGSDDGCA